MQPLNISALMKVIFCFFTLNMFSLENLHNFATELELTFTFIFKHNVVILKSYLLESGIKQTKRNYL